MQVTRLTSLFSRAKQIYRTEGLITLLWRVFAFLRYRLLEYRTYHLYAAPIEEILQASDENDIVPGIGNSSVKVVSSNDEADELEAQGFEVRSQATDVAKRLDSGATAFCVFVGRELACIGWVALTQEAMNSLDEPPYKVHFADHESCTGRYWTSPKYRGKGLAPYASFNTIKFLHERGIQVNRTAMNTGNFSSVRATERAGFKAYGEGRYLRVLWWKSWRERPLGIEEQEAIRQTNEPHS
jgi:GNAT superfamily N-acetyltransferase